MIGWWRRRVALKDLEVILYTRDNCPLCDKAAMVLRPAARRYGFRVVSVNIDTNPALVARYGWLVPVVVIAGRERFRGHVNPHLLDRILRVEVDRITDRT